MAQNKKVLILFEVDNNNAIKNVKKMSVGLDGVAKSSEKAAKELENLDKKTKSTAGSAGIAGAATAEFGRLISDLPYGLSAVTNNISQLGSMFALLVSSAGSVRAALSAMGATLLGPAGILVLFQSAVALLELYSQNSKKAKVESISFSGSLDEEARALEIVTNKLSIQNLTLEQRLELLERYGLINAKNKEELQEAGLSLEKQLEFLRLQEEILKKRRELEASRALDKNQEVTREDQLEAAQKRKLELQEQFNEIGEDIARRNKYINNLDVDHLKSLKGIDAINANANKRLALYAQYQRENTKDLREQEVLQRKINDTEVIISAAKQESAEIDAQITKLKKEQNALYKGEGPGIGSLEFLENEIKLLKESRDNTATNTKEFEQYNNQIAKFELAIRKLKDGEPIPVDLELTLGGAELSDKTIVDTYFGGKKGKGVIKQGIQDQLADSIPTVDEMNSALSAKAKGGETALSLEKMLGMKDSAEKMKAHMDNVKQGLSALNEVFAAQAERDLAIEQNKTTAQNDQLRERLRNEKLTADQRDAINQQIAQNEAALIAKQNKIKEKAFKREKAMRIAMGLVDTASNALKAFGSQLVPGDPTTLPRAIAAAALATTVGMAQVIAISKQKFTPQESPSPTLLGPGTSGAGAAGGPSFNVVGASTQNQLIDAINQRNQQPVKAYVVSTEISTAQELDRKIVSGAAI